MTNVLFSFVCHNLIDFLQIWIWDTQGFMWVYWDFGKRIGQNGQPSSDLEQPRDYVSDGLLYSFVICSSTMLI